MGPAHANRGLRCDPVTIYKAILLSAFEEHTSFDTTEDLMNAFTADTCGAQAAIDEAAIDGVYTAEELESLTGNEFDTMYQSTLALAALSEDGVALLRKNFRRYNFMTIKAMKNKASVAVQTLQARYGPEVPVDYLDRARHCHGMGQYLSDRLSDEFAQL